MTLDERYALLALLVRSGDLDPDEAEALAGLLARRALLGPVAGDEERLAASPLE